MPMTHNIFIFLSFLILTLNFNEKVFLNKFHKNIFLTWLRKFHLVSI
jgi:hypothetical protein